MTVEKYLGIHEFTHQSVNENLLYKDGFYEIPIADGEMLVFCQTKKVEYKGEERYILLKYYAEVIPRCAM